MIKKIAQKLNLPEDVAKVLLQVSNKLKSHNIPFQVIGGIAVGVHSSPRTTKDVDFIIKSEDINKIKKLYVTNPLLMSNQDGLSTNIDGVDVDFIIINDEESFLFEGNKSIPVENHSFDPLSAANLIYMKLQSQRTKDMSDVIEILKKDTNQIPLLKKEIFLKIKNSDLNNKKQILSDVEENFDSLANIALLEEKKSKNTRTAFYKAVLNNLNKTN